MLLETESLLANELLGSGPRFVPHARHGPFAVMGLSRGDEKGEWVVIDKQSFSQFASAWARVEGFL